MKVGSSTAKGRRKARNDALIILLTPGCCFVLRKLIKDEGAKAGTRKMPKYACLGGGRGE